jgi:hypothetical protein
MPPLTRWIVPDSLDFPTIQTRLLRYISKADQNIKVKCGTVKKEHFQIYKATISYHNERIFFSKLKNSLASFWAPAPLCTENALQALRESLPENFNFKDMIQWISRQDIISNMETFDISTSSLDNSQSGDFTNDTDIDSSQLSIIKAPCTSEMQSDSDSSNLNISGIIAIENSTDLELSDDDRQDILSAMEEVENHYVEVESADNSFTNISERVDDPIILRKEISRFVDSETKSFSEFQSFMTIALPTFIYEENNDIRERFGFRTCFHSLFTRHYLLLIIYFES